VTTKNQNNTARNNPWQFWVAAALPVSRNLREWKLASAGADDNPRGQSAMLRAATKASFSGAKEASFP
jgi:hypothetical protein